MTKPPKARIRDSFERAAATYDSAAVIQRAICDDLLAALPTNLPATEPHRLLDAGCGTGYALPRLQSRFPKADAIALDLSKAMLGQIAVPCRRIAGDLEQLPLADDCIDLFWTSLSVQWCDLDRVLAEARRVLRPGGTLALASLGRETFHELRTAFASVDGYTHTLAFHDAAEIGTLATRNGLIAGNLKNTPKQEFFPDLKTLLRSVKAIGANQVGSGRRTGLMSRTAFAAAEAAYETLRTPAGLPLTYDVVTLLARKASETP